jgi:phosphohistidine phosphatase SixA
MNLVSGKINLLLIDEALDKNISDIGVSRILDYIRTLNNRILLVSHKPTVASYFSTKLLVTRHNGESKAIIV